MNFDIKRSGLHWTLDDCFGRQVPKQKSSTHSELRNLSLGCESRKTSILCLIAGHFFCYQNNVWLVQKKIWKNLITFWYHSFIVNLICCNEIDNLTSGMKCTQWYIHVIKFKPTNIKINDLSSILLFTLDLLVNIQTKSSLERSVVEEKYKYKWVFNDKRQGRYKSTCTVTSILLISTYNLILSPDWYQTTWYWCNNRPDRMPLKLKDIFIYKSCKLATNYICFMLSWSQFNLLRFQYNKSMWK
jgi:hypothetical protein